MSNTRKPILKNGTRVVAQDGCGGYRFGVVVDYESEKLGAQYRVLMDDRSWDTMPVGYHPEPGLEIGWHVIPEDSKKSTR